MNSTIVFIFKRTNTSTPPIRPAADLSYAFDSGFLSGALAGWEQSLPVSGGAYRWVTSAVVTGTTNSVIVPVSAWRAVSLLSEDGTSRHTATVYKKSTLAPTSPAASSSSYDFVTGVLTPPSGWSVTQPATTTMNTWAVDYTFTGLDNETVVGTGYWGQAKVVAVAGIDGQHAHVVTIYKQTIEEIATPTGGSYKFDGDILVVPSGWSRTMPTVSDRPTYMSTHRFSSNDPLEVISGSLWSYPVVISRLGYDYVNRFLSTCFTYSLEAPATPVEGDYDNPVPTGWSDGIPELVEGQDLWSTSRVFYASNLISNPWSTPVKITNNTSLTNKLQFSSNNTSWHDAAVPGDIYMRSGTNDGNGWVFSASIVIKGESGEQGSIGNPGVQLYTWIAYAFDLGGVNGFTTGSPAEEHKCIGIAHNKSSAIESTNPSDYIWTKWVGNVGETGANGVSTFTWFAYANSEDGVTDFTTGARTNHLYIGMAFNKFTSIESQDPADYAWSRMSALDPASMLETLTGEITASELHADLNARIDLIDAAPDNILDSLVTLDATWGENLLELAQGQAMEVQDRAAAVLAEATARADAITLESAEIMDSLATETLARTTAITLEQTTRANAFIAEAAARTAAILDEANTRIAAINAEASTRSSQFIAEAAARTAAITVETDTRAAALLAEAEARGTAITNESNTRQAADAALASDITTLTTSVGNNASAIQTEATTRANADTAESLLRVALAARVTLAEGSITENTAAISSESTTRANADSANAQSITNLAVRVTDTETGITDNAAAIVTEATTRADAISAEALLRNSLETVVSGHTTAIYEEQLVRSTQYDAMASDVDVMAASVLNTVTTITNEAVIRATETSALAQSISLMTAGVSGGFDSGVVWYFDSGVEGWTASNAAITQANGWIHIVATGSNPKAISPVISVIGSQYSLIKLRVKRVSGDGWVGKLRYSTSGHGFSDSYYLELAAPEFDIQGNAVINFEMSDLTAGGNDWIANIITGVEITLGATAADVLDIDYIAIGRSAPGASVASVTAEAIARADAISNEASVRDALATQIRGSATGTDIATLTSGLLYNERVARTTADSAEVTARQALEAVVNHTTTGLSAAHAAVVAEQSARVSADNAEAALRVSLAAVVNNATTGLSAAHSAIAEEAATRASADETEATARSAISSVINNETTGLVAAHAAIEAEALTRANEDETIAGTVTVLSAQVNNEATGLPAAHAAITSEATARFTEDTAIALTVTALSGQVNDETTGLPAAHAAVITEAATRVSEDEAIAETVSTLSAQVNNEITGLPAAHAAVVEEARVRVVNEGATAETISGIQSDLDTPTTGVKARITTVEAATVTLDGSIVTTTNELYAELNLAGEAILGGLTDMTEVQQVSMAYIVDEREARVSELEAVTTAMELMQTSIAGNAAGILSEAETRSTADTAEANARLALQATVEANQANITTNYITTATATSAIATAKSEAIASSNGNTAALLTGYTTTTTMTGAIAAAKSEAIAAANGNTATLLQGYYTEAEVDSASAGWIASAVSTADGHTATSLESYTNTSSMTEAISTAKSVIAASLNSTFRQTGVPATRVGGYPLEIGDLWIKAVAGGDEKYLYDGEGWAISPDAVSAANTAAIAVEQNVRAKVAGPLWQNVGFTKGETVIDVEGDLYQCILTHTMGQALTNTTYWKPITANLYAQYTVKLDVNGKVTGFGLSNDGATSIFEIVTDKFAITTTAGDVTKTPFIVGQVDGVSTVGIDGNLVVDGSIKAHSIDTSTLIVGNNIAMGANAVINWNNISTAVNTNVTPTSLGVIKTDLTNAPSTILNTNVTATSIGAVKTDLSNAPSGILNSSLPTIYSQAQIEDFSTSITNSTVTTAFVDALNVTAASVSADNITAGTLTGLSLLVTDGYMEHFYIDSSAHSLLYSCNFGNTINAEIGGNATAPIVGRPRKVHWATMGYAVIAGNADGFKAGEPLSWHYPKAPLRIEPSAYPEVPTHSADIGALWVTSAGVLYINTSGSTTWTKVGAQ